MEVVRIGALETGLSWDPIAEAHRQWREHGWDDAADGMAFVTSIIRTQQLLLARVHEVLRPLDLSFARYELLRLVSFARDGAMSMARASQRLQVHPTSVTSTVDRLERDGMVERTAHPMDGRAVLVRITPAGLERTERATLELNRFFAKPGLGTGDLQTLIGILARYRRDAGDYEEPQAPPESLSGF